MKLLGIGSRVQHNDFGKGVVVNNDGTDYWISFLESGIETLPLDTELTIIERCEDDVDTVSLFEVENSLRSILKKWSDVTQVVPIASKYKRGTLILKPEDGNLASKEIPMEQFWNKIIMLRDRLRVMEQKINSSNLENGEKVDLQQYITRIYGSLTTFNVLFASKDDNFKGTGK